MSPPGKTLSTLDDADHGDDLKRTAVVFLVLECDRPTAPAARICLADVDALVIGRGETLEVNRELSDGKLMRELRIEDGWLSGTHARITRKHGQWWLADCDSKNGTRLNGAELGESALQDGDIIGVGHSLLLFKTVPLPANTPVLVRTTELTSSVPGIVTFDLTLAAQLDNVARIAPSVVSVLVYGESGTGKEMIAHAVHELSGRGGPFVAVNCGALPATLIESQLFGYCKGAFSGATEDREGLIRSADGGTLFLDEIGDLPLSAQAALLRALQEGEVTPVGATRPIAVDVRIISATHRDLAQMIENAEFREDLFARLAGLSVRLPPLRDRIMDVGVLMAPLLSRVAGANVDRVRFTSAAGQLLLAHRWPRNTRELLKCLQTAVVLAGGEPIAANHLPENLREPNHEPTASPRERSRPTAKPLSPADRDRKAQLKALMQEHSGNITTIARLMNTSRTQIQRWAKRYGIDAASYRS